MSRKQLLLATIALLAAATGVVVAAVVGAPALDATLQTDSVHPGQETTLSLTVVNNGSVEQGSVQNPALTQRVTTARGVRIVVDREDEVPLSVRTGPQSVGSLPEGGAAPLEVPVSVDDDADPGRYRLPINVSYRHTAEIEDDGTEETENVSRTLYVPLRIEEAPRFRVRDVSTSLRVASSETVAVTVENVGSATAGEAVLTLESPNPDLGFGGSPTATRFVGEWPAGETHTVEFELVASEAATAQEYPLDLSVAYENEDGVAGASETGRFSVRPNPEGTFAVENVSSTLAVGDDGRLVGSVRNTGGEQVRNAVVVFADQAGTVTARETESPVGDLAGGEAAEFGFPIEVSEDATAGQRQFSVLVRYRTPGGDLRESDTMDVSTTVGQESPAFALEAPGATVSPGESTRLTVRVTNTGGEPYSDVSAKLFAENPLGTADDAAFVQRLDPGETENVTFEISANAGALEKSYPVSLDFRYDEADGDTETSDTYRLPVTVVADEGGGPPYLLIGLVLAVALGAAGYHYRSRR